MNIKITQAEDVGNMNKNYLIQVTTRYEEILNRDLLSEVTKELVKHMVDEFKPEVSKYLKENIQQLVKDVGADITIAGLKHLMKSKKVNKK